jgi:enoyl-CoA hydratase/carnithine racemase
MAMQDFVLDDYKDWFEFVHLSRNDAGVLEVRLHRDGDVLDWAGDTLAEVGLMFGVIGQDPANRVIVFTGTGEYFIKTADVDTTQNVPVPTESWVYADAWARRLSRNLLNIEIPIVAAVNGPCMVHSELAIMSDLIVASETAWFQDTRHFTVGRVPGDGIMLPWMRLLGPNKGRQFLLQGLRITAQEALERGIIAEVLPQDQVLARAHDLANDLAKSKTQLLRYTRMLATREYRRDLELDGGYGAALQGLSGAEYRPGPAGLLPFPQGTNQMKSHSDRSVLAAI